jgi:hypothetical protein
MLAALTRSRLGRRIAEAGRVLFAGEVSTRGMIEAGGSGPRWHRNANGPDRGSHGAAEGAAGMV